MSHIISTKKKSRHIEPIQISFPSPINQNANAFAHINHSMQSHKNNSQIN